MGKKNKRNVRREESTKPPELEIVKSETDCSSNSGSEKQNNRLECPAAKDEALSAFLQSIIGEDGGKTLLVKFSLNGNAKSLDQLLTAGADVNTRCDEKISSEKKYHNAPILCCAVWEGHPDCVEILLQHGANINLKGCDGKSAVHVAVQENKVECLKLIIERVDNVDSSSDNDTLLMLAAKYGSIDCLKTLLKARADINNEKNKSVLHCAVIGKDPIQCIKELLKAGANVNQVDKSGDTALHIASKEGALDCIKELIAAGADVNARGECMETPVMKAAKANHPECVTALTEAGADANAVTLEGISAVMYAARESNPRSLEVLIKAGADLNLVDKFKQTALLSAGRNIIQEHVVKYKWGTETCMEVNQDAKKCLGLLIEAGVDVNDANNKELVHEAVTKCKYTHMLEILLEAGADVNMQFNGHSLTSCAVMSEDLDEDILEMLIKAGANLAQQDGDGQTALFLACTSEDEKISTRALLWAIKAKDQRFVKLLKGAEVNLTFGFLCAVLLKIKNLDLDMLKEVLRNSKIPRAVELMSVIHVFEYAERFHVDVRGSNLIQTVALRLAAECGDEDSVEELIENYGASVNGEIQLCPTPLTQAAKHDNLSALKVLVKKGADMNIVGKKERTALHYAAKFDNRACVRVLLDAGADENAKDERGRTAGDIAFKEKSRDCIKLLQKVDLDSSSSSSDSSTSSNSDSSSSSWSSLDSSSWF